MKENKFKVWCEFEFGGEIVKKMEGPESWFLLTQTGKLMTYGPEEPLQELDKAYKVAIPLFYTGLKDKDGKEIYEGDIISFRWYIFGKKEDVVGSIEYKAPQFLIRIISPEDLSGKQRGWDILSLNKELVGVIGNIYENPELLEEK